MGRKNSTKTLFLNKKKTPALQTSWSKGGGFFSRSCRIPPTDYSGTRKKKNTRKKNTLNFFFKQPAAGGKFWGFEVQKRGFSLLGKVGFALGERLWILKSSKFSACGGLFRYWQEMNSKFSMDAKLLDNSALLSAGFELLRYPPVYLSCNDRFFVFGPKSLVFHKPFLYSQAYTFIHAAVSRDHPVYDCGYPGTGGDFWSKKGKRTS